MDLTYRQHILRRIDLDLRGLEKRKLKLLKKNGAKKVSPALADCILAIAILTKARSDPSGLFLDIVGDVYAKLAARRTQTTPR